MEQRCFRHLVASFLTLALLLASTVLPATVQSVTKQTFLPSIRSSSIALAVYSITPTSAPTARIDVVSPTGSVVSGTNIDLVCGDPVRWALHKPMFACPIRNYVDGHFHYLGGRVGKADGTVVGIDGGYSDVAWSPDGTRLAFETGPGDDLYVIGLDGTHLTHLGTGIGMHWSPDGRRLALLHYATDIEVVTLATGERRLLPWSYGEAWSPDGQAMAMVTDINGGVVTIAPLDGRAPVQITGLRNAGELSWSPDSTWLALTSVSDDEHGMQLLTVSRDRGRVVKLITGLYSYSWVW